jgi:hypothetical protein
MVLKDEEIQKIKDQWAREAAQEELKIVRKAAIGRYYRRGWVAGVVWVAGFMVRRETLDICPECGGCLNECEEVVTKQQIAIVEKSFIVTEYHCHTYICPDCQTTHTASAPEETRSGLFSAGLIALAAYLKGRCHVSFSVLKAFFHDVMGIAISGGLVEQIQSQ